MVYNYNNNIETIWRDFMNIRNTQELRAFAAQRVENSPSQKQILLIYAGIVLGLAALIPIINYIIDLQIDQYSGLRHLGRRSMLSSIQLFLPFGVNLITMCLDLGYVAAMLRIARGQYVSPQTLRLGFDRFWVLLRSKILRALIYFGALTISVYLGVLLFMLSPFSADAKGVVLPYVSDPNALMAQEAVYSQFLDAIVPAYALCGVLFILLCGPIFYSYRMVNYLLIDNPAMGAREALRQSKRMMRTNRRYLLKLDVFQWAFYLGLLATRVLCYGDLIAPVVGISLPGHEDIWYFVFLAAYIAATFAVYFFFKNKVETAYALAYDAIRPAPPKDNSVVLGNVFQM